MNWEAFEAELSALPLYIYSFFEPEELEFSDRVRWICEHECAQYGQSWACPPGVGTVESCKAHCLSFKKGLLVSTITEVEDISDIAATLATRREHEEVTDQVAALMKQHGIAPFVLSTESCAVCPRCACLDGKPCRFPDRMHPCVESQGINVIPLLEKNGLEFQYGQNVVTWISLLLF